MDSITGMRGLSASLGWRDLVEPSEEAPAVKRDEPRPLRSGPGGAPSVGGGSALLSRLGGAAAALREGAAFRQWRASASPGLSGRALVSAVAGPGAAPGVHRVEVVELARTERVFGSVEADAEAPLGLAGGFLLNGREVLVTEGDSLADVRDRINAANRGLRRSGVTAAILTGAPGAHRLVLTADSPGFRGIELVDGAGARGALRWLGIADGTTVPNWSPTSPEHTESQRMADAAAPVAALLGIAPPPPTTVRVGGRRLRVDLGTDSLLSLMEELGGEPAATVVEEEAGGRSWYRLAVSGTVEPDPAATLPGEGAPSAAARAASHRIVELLGFVRPVPMDALPGADALVRIDGALIRRRSNVLSDALPGVSLSLLASDAALCAATASGAGLSVARHGSLPPGRYPVVLLAPGSAGDQAETLTIDGEPALRDRATGAVRGRPGSRFASLELRYTGGGAPGPVGELVVSGEIGVLLSVDRDREAVVEAVSRFVGAYNETLALGRRWSESRPVPADGPPRSRHLILTLAQLAALPLPAEERLGIRWGRLDAMELDAARLRAALPSAWDEARDYFAALGTGVLDALKRAEGELAQEMRSAPAAEDSAGHASMARAVAGGRSGAAADDGWRTPYAAAGVRSRGRLDLLR